VKARKREYQARARDARAHGRVLPPHPYQSYDPESTAKLAEIVGLKNKGIKYNPDWNSALAAREWIGRQQAREPQNASWQKWGVREIDLDNNVSTPDNVVLFSDQGVGKIRAIDGHYITQPQNKKAQRAYYEDYPTQADRKQIDPKEKSFLKAYYRRYPTRAQQLAHPMETFVQEKSAFNIVKEMIQRFLTQLGFKIYSKEKHPDGNIKLTNFMTLLQINSYDLQGYSS
jgi:hypothetical protein